ncbi:ribulose-bisphosphate carboxylase [Natronomonas pharaonis DSM 2160]|uniref:Ribulose bisphosphate carboxylase n=1 Tax=Natronomonas pharaonis (strain ATCC 35678 / DSM 2160 / CIP 103997 / JCM 8858 / NBRC 14720 / NCIMB 2260 / Gabara) TaxID=348780 RepID=A0A1U7EWL2_NATPD|nr:type III ribulose-bisphosphate carboxylase [Natronomonas pharaonis]CAI49476.1 ribulose-bisphosphate carboxylase [Natronomonas pharaonis DSM 2160]
MEYADFLDESYEPSDDDLVCTFRLVPGEGISVADAAARVASESSNGTWAALSPESDVRQYSALACDIGPEDEHGTQVTVAYPSGLFEDGSLPQILSCIAGNIMGMKAVETIRLLDCEWPAVIARSFPGPQYGSDVRTELLDAGDRPPLATVPKPKVGLSTEEHVSVAESAWRGGVDLLKDDENLTDQTFNPFEQRVADSFAARDRLEEETGERKDYLVNITAETDEMVRRAEFVDDHGGSFVMVDIITCGWSGLQTVRRRTEDLDLAIHAHRAMHAAFDRLPQHGVSMRCLAQFARLAGVDHIHTGTAGLGKLENEDTAGINEWLRSDLHGHSDVLPVASGGLHPGIVDQLLDALGTNVMVQAGGGIHGHPDGTEAGARALRAAVDAYADGESLDSRAESVPALRTALDEWGTQNPR